MHAEDHFTVERGGGAGADTRYQRQTASLVLTGDDAHSNRQAFAFGLYSRKFDFQLHRTGFKLGAGYDQRSGGLLTFLYTAFAHGIIAGNGAGVGDGGSHCLFEVELSLHFDEERHQITEFYFIELLCAVKPG